MSETTKAPASWWVLSAAELSRVERSVEERGICTQPDADADDWFPAEQDGGPPSENARTTSLERAALLCEGCPVLAECRKAALNRPDRSGVFGGLPGWALEEIRRTDPVERVAIRENYEPMVILGERSRYELVGLSVTRADRAQTAAADAGLDTFKDAA